MDRSSLIRRSILFLLAFMLFLSYSAFSGGIRWFHRLNVKAPTTVNATVTNVNYVGASPSGTVGQAILKGQYSTLFDNLPAVITSGRIVTTGIIGQLTLAAVKMMGPVLITSLGMLVWDSLLNMWVKMPVVSTGNSNYPSCHDAPIGVIVKNSDGIACVRYCSENHNCPTAINPGAPWVLSNYYFGDPVSISCHCNNGISYTKEFRNGNYVQPSDAKPMPATDDEILAELTKVLNSNTSALADFVNRVVDKTDLGPSILNASTSSSLTGPASVDKTSTSTSTDQSGQTATATKTTYNLSYSPSTTTVTVTTTTTTTVTDPSGTTKTTTETNTGDIDPTTDDPPPDGSKDDGPQQSDICKTNPDILACILLGTLEDQTIPEKSGPSNISKEMSAVGSCPADIDLTILGHQFSISWIYFCQFAERIRPILLALTWVLAGIFVIRSMSSE